MKKSVVIALLAVGGVTLPALGDDNFLASQRWNVRFDIGGSMPADADLNVFDGPVTGGSELELDPGMQFDMAVGYRLNPWLSVEGELGFLFNEVDAVGNWSYPDSGLSHLLFMVNLVVEPRLGNVVPFAGVGVGGDLSTIGFGEGYYYYWEPDGWGSDFVFAYQAFGGIRYEFNDNFSLGVVYRFFGTQEQKWDVDWWSGADFTIGVEAIRVHSVCLVFAGSF